ncbi:MAG: integrase core domain-containing protein [Acidobacteriota bacterium]|nr:integrase core domain-containing protein [Acidobacteriota bacterium]
MSKEAAKRLQWFDYYRRCGNARKTCRYFGISAQTFYRWKNRFDPYDLTTLEGESRRPQRVRHPETPEAVVERIRQLREQYPRWGKEKLAVLLKREGHDISGSTVERVMRRLRSRGLLVEPENVRQAKLARKRRRKPRYAVRKPRDYRVEAPGDLVQVDTLQVRLCPNEVRFQFSARDMVVRFDGLRAYRRQTSTAGADFLHYLRKKFPFPIKAIQIDGGSEFKDQFEEACRRRAIRLFELPPNSPKLNGRVERANRTHREEFYEVNDVDLGLEEHNRQLEEWAYIYNHIRPHQALDYLTPYEYYRQWKRTQKTNVSLMP